MNARHHPGLGLETLTSRLHSQLSALQALRETASSTGLGQIVTLSVP